MEHLLFEHPCGYALFELKEYEDLSKASYEEYMRLAEVVKYASGMTFGSVDVALDHLQHLSRGEIHDGLRRLLELCNVKTLHCDPSLKKGLETIGIRQRTSEGIMRGVRREAGKLIKDRECDDSQMALGLAYSYSRDKVEYNVKRDDCIVIHTVLLLEQVDKDINSYSMRVKEMYGWSFPELASVVKDNARYIEAVRYFLGNGDELNEEFEKIRGCRSMELSELDLANLQRLVDVVGEKIAVRKSLMEYLREKMSSIAPNLAAILGDILAARLISQAGGLFNLGKAPASTVQLLGAEKSLFRCLKTRSNTPKHGLLYTSKCLSRVRDKDKGKLSRFIATKCSIAAKIDCFSENRTPAYGLELKALVDKKIRSLRTNEEVERTDSVVQRVFAKIQGIEEPKKHRKADAEDRDKETFRFAGTGDVPAKRVSFDLTRNDVKETERMGKRRRRV